MTASEQLLTGEQAADWLQVPLATLAQTVFGDTIRRGGQDAA